MKNSELAAAIAALPRITRDQITTLHKQGSSFWAVAARLSVNVEIVRGAYHAAIGGDPAQLARQAKVAERNAAIVKMHSEGVRIAAIERRLGVSGPTVRKVLKESKQKSPTPAAPRRDPAREEKEARNAAILELRKGGLSLASISRRLRISVECVRDVLRAAGIDTSAVQPKPTRSPDPVAAADRPDDSPALRPGHAISWNAITAGTSLAGLAYPRQDR